VVELVETTDARYLRQAEVPVIRLSDVPVVEPVETTGARFLRQAQVPVIDFRRSRWLSLSKPLVPASFDKLRYRSFDFGGPGG
jgi:hypothetical protein